nr:MAG TPA: hypothetical protein [Caudoviricetes sp.]DAR50535.1 MAG TPA: hypothetical protein [Caudoviricetes sp.]
MPGRKIIFAFRRFCTKWCDLIYILNNRVIR